MEENELVEMLEAPDGTSQYGCCGPKCCREPEREEFRKASRERNAEGYEASKRNLEAAELAVSAGKHDKAEAYVKIADAWHTISYY